MEINLSGSTFANRLLPAVLAEKFDCQMIWKLKALREAIKESAPNAEETMRWQIPASKLNGDLFSFCYS